MDEGVDVVVFMVLLNGGQTRATWMDDTRAID